MVSDALYFIPVVLCLYWFVRFFTKKDRSSRQTILMIIGLMLMPYFITYASYSMSTINYTFITYSERIGLTMAYMVMGATTIYLYNHIKESPPRIWQALIMMPGMVYGAVQNMLYMIIGQKDAELFLMIADNNLPVPERYDNRLFDTFRFIDYDLTFYIAIPYIIIIFSECAYLLRKGNYKFGNFFRFLFLGFHANPINVIALFIIFIWCLMLPLTIMMPTYLPSHQDLSIGLLLLVSLIIHTIFIAEYHSDIEYFTFRNLYYNKDYHSRRKQEEKQTQLLRGAAHTVAESQEPLSQQTEHDAGSPAMDAAAEHHDLSYGEKRQIDLINSFRQLMTDEQLFRDADLDILQVAERLNVGRTTLSAVINKAYGKNFRSVINDYRIEYAKEYMHSNRMKRQEEIAFACGFNDAPAFSHKFKEITGMTPLMWAKKH